MADDVFNFGEDLLAQEVQTPRAQIQYPLDVQSRGILKAYTSDTLPELNRVQALTLRSGDTTFDVRGTNSMSITAASAVSISKIRNGNNGQLLTLIFNDSNVTLVNNTTGATNTINLSGPNITSRSGTTLNLIHNGTSWRALNSLESRIFSGSQGIAAAGGTTTITVNFEVKTVYCFNSGAAVANFGMYMGGTNIATRETTALSTTRCWLVTGAGLGGLINNVTATSFDMVADNTGTVHTVYFTAIGQSYA